MEFQIWWFWFGAAALFVIGEIFTAGFFLLWFGIGAAVSGIVALLGLNSLWQWLCFIVVTGVLVVTSRKFADKFSKKQPPGIGANRFIEERGVVIEEIDNLKNTGKVRIEKEIWLADSANDEILKVGDLIKVLRIEGTHMVVEKLTKPSQPEQKGE